MSSEQFQSDCVYGNMSDVISSIDFCDEFTLESVLCQAFSYDRQDIVGIISKRLKRDWVDIIVEDMMMHFEYNNEDMIDKLYMFYGACKNNVVSIISRTILKFYEKSFLVEYKRYDFLDVFETKNQNVCISVKLFDGNLFGCVSKSNKRKRETK